MSTPLDDARPNSLGARSAALSERGRRTQNQDAALITTLPDGGELVAVADGMGGHSAGELASQTALEALHTALAGGTSLDQAVRAANAAVRALAEAEGHHGMGTTLVVMLRQGSRYTVANVGDSRAYRIDRRETRQLTQDHSFVAEAVRSGQLSAEEASRSRWRNAVTRAIGTEEDVQVDSFGPFSAEDPHVLLLCTDGLYRALGDDAIRALVMTADHPARIVEMLARAAYDAGADDNISAALIRFGGDLPAGGITTPRGIPTAGSTPREVLLVAPNRQSHWGGRSSRSGIARTGRFIGAAAVVAAAAMLLWRLL
jgi:PPM family protein phosphatase